MLSFIVNVIIIIATPIEYCQSFVIVIIRRTTTTIVLAEAIEIAILLTVGITVIMINKNSDHSSNDHTKNTHHNQSYLTMVAVTTIKVNYAYTMAICWPCYPCVRLFPPRLARAPSGCPSPGDSLPKPAHTNGLPLRLYGVGSSSSIGDVSSAVVLVQRVPRAMPQPAPA